MATKKKTTLDTFKDRNRNHVKNETQLSKYIWELKYKNTDYTLTWDVERKSNLGPRKSGLCNLCLEEKYEIIRNKEALNKRLELISKCRHRTRPTRKPPEHEYDLSHRTRSQRRVSLSEDRPPDRRETAGSRLRIPRSTIVTTKRDSRARHTPTP